jgi:hypothetical protein
MSANPDPNSKTDNLANEDCRPVPCSAVCGICGEPVGDLWPWHLDCKPSNGKEDYQLTSTISAGPTCGGRSARRFRRLCFWYILRWMRGPVGIVQGLAQTISLGYWEPYWLLKIEGWFLDYATDVNDLIQPNDKDMARRALNSECERPSAGTGAQGQLLRLQ